MRTTEQIEAGLWSYRCGEYRTQARRLARGSHLVSLLVWVQESRMADQERQAAYRDMVRANIAGSRPKCRAG